MNKILKPPSIVELATELPAIPESYPVSKLSYLFMQLNTDTLPVANKKGEITGIVSEYDINKVLPEWCVKKNSYQIEFKVSEIMTKDIWTETINSDVRELLNKLTQEHTRIVPIVDKNGKYSGSSIIRKKIIYYLTKMIKPISLGGLATPLGVYITDGKNQAGAGNLGLFLTGISFGFIMRGMEIFLAMIGTALNINPEDPSIIPISFLATIVLFISILRLTPLVKIHAAEHQTINAIEKGLPLTLETVKMQPREHKRCGTNLMVLIIGIELIALISSVYLSNFEPFVQSTFLFIGFVLVFSFWRDVGMIIQKYLTTVKAPDKYILNGIEAGEEILRKHKENLTIQDTNFFQKIWATGILQLITGAMATIYFINFLQLLLYVKII